VFLTPEVFANGDDSTAWVPLQDKGSFVSLASGVYHKDEWAKEHPIFEGLPAGGLLDYAFYRGIVPSLAWVGEDPHAEVVAGAIHAAPDYSSGSLLSTHRVGSGRFVLNTLRIRENLGVDPAAERLLRNLLNYAAEDSSLPLEDPPADLDSLLKSLGFEG
jgi:hypothetical protein